jgi:branched-chain amino acid aminotransferase
MRTYNGRPFLYDRHLRRLRRSAAMISLEVPFTDDELSIAIDATTAGASLGDAEAYIRVLVTRGIGELTYDPKATPAASFVIIVKPLPQPEARLYDAGVRVVIVDVVRNHPGSVNPMIKSNNLMNSALAMQAAIKQGAFEGIMRNYRGELSECTTANLFVVKKGAVLTPPLEAGILPGITREFVFEVGATIGVAVREATLRDDDVYGADEAFLTSTTREILPITTAGDRSIGDGAPGPITRQLLAGYRQAAANGGSNRSER